MSPREAEQTLAVIRTLMERSTCYTHLSAHAGLAAGGITLLGSLARGYGAPMLPTWTGVLVASAAAVAFFTARLARSHREPFWTRQSRTVVASLLPALAAAAVLTGLLVRLDREALLPGVWMLLWGTGALSMSFFTPRVISGLGASFLLAGTLTLLLEPRIGDALAMALTFGAIHIAYGLVLALARPIPHVGGEARADV